jgi:hypothetical protein
MFGEWNLEDTAPDGMLFRHKDPREDMASDRPFWVKLLTWTYKNDPELFGVLHGFRCYGTVIKRVKGEIEFEPRVEYDAFESEDDANSAVQEWLVPMMDRFDLALEKALG